MYQRTGYMYIIPSFFKNISFLYNIVTNLYISLLNENFTFWLITLYLQGFARFICTFELLRNVKKKYILFLLFQKFFIFFHMKYNVNVDKLVRKYENRICTTRGMLQNDER